MNQEQRKKRIENAVKVAGMLVMGFFVAPFVFVSIQGLIGLIIAVAVAFTGINMLPWFGMKVANWRLKAIKHEAMTNPVETLQNQLAEKQNALDAYKENIGKFNGQVMAFEDQVKQYVREGLEDAQVYVGQLEKMKQLKKVREDKFTDAKADLEEFKETIARTDKKWKMALAAAAMNEAAGEIDGDVFDKIAIETSLESVTAKLNQSFAELDIALMEDRQKAQIEAPLSRTQSLEIDNQPATVKVRKQ